MITSRRLTVEDLPVLQKALDDCKSDPGQKVESYTGDHCISIVYEDEKSPIIVFRFTKVLRAAAAWIDEADTSRNGPAIIKSVEETVEIARLNGYTEIVFETHNPALAKFCEDKLGFKKIDGEYVRYV